MAVPQINGSFGAHSPGTGPNYTLNLSAIPNGSWMVVSVMSGIDTPITPPAGWVTFANRIQSGTRRNYLYGKIKTVDDGSSAVFVAGAVNTISFGMLWGSGADSVDTWTLGTQWTRSANSLQTAGSRTDTIAPSVTTTGNDRLALAISHEATLLMAQAEEITSYTPSEEWTRNLWVDQVGPSDRIETIWIASKPMPTPGPTGNVTLTYISPQDANSWAAQLIIPSPEPGAEPTSGVVGIPTTYSGNTNTTFTLSKPAGVQTGDYIVVAVRGQSSTATAHPASPGFTRLGPEFFPSTNTYRMNGFYGHPVTDAGSEPSEYTFTFTASASNMRLLATAFIVRGVNIEVPLAGYNDSYAGTVITGGMRADSYTTADAPTLSLFMAGSEFTADAAHTPATSPSGYTPVASLSSSANVAVSRTFLWVGSREETTTSVSAASITWTSATAPAVESIALRSVDTPTPDPAGTGYIAADGNGNEVKIYHTSEDGVRTPSKVFPMLRGFNSVAEMLATPGFTWGHRGGSASWPEMSLYGYTRAVARGYGVLEVSLGRTSDGVWFGLHDQTTDRTSGGTYGNANAQTWAQVQMQHNQAGPGAPRPYMSWDELIAAYGHTHVIVADPKYALGSYRTEFLDMVDRDLGSTRAIIKYSGVGSGATNLSTAAKARGYTTWGFFYASDASAGVGGSGALQTYGPAWDLIGMEYGASQAVWDEALALGKPVIGHIAPNQAAYDAAIAKGASGVQVSGVGVVAPVSWWTP